MIFGPLLILSWSPLAFLEKMENAANADLSVGCDHFSIGILNIAVYLYIERNAAGNCFAHGLCNQDYFLFYFFIKASLVSM